MFSLLSRFFGWVLSSAFSVNFDLLGFRFNQTCDKCYSSTFNAISAALATQGYWVQANLLDYFNFTSFGNIAALLYIFAVMGALVGLATGMPPKTWLWFIVGPVMYTYLLTDRHAVKGVGWIVDGSVGYENQAEVWKLAEVGIVNSGYFRNRALTERDLGFGGRQYSADTGPNTTARVSTFFLWVDSYVSWFVSFLVDWVGPNSALPGTVLNLATGTTNLPEDFGSMIADAVLPNNSLDHWLRRDKWYLLTNAKWGFMESISKARLASGDARDAFATFMASECGDILNSEVDLGAYTAAAHANGRDIPSSIFKQGGNPLSYAMATPPSYTALASRLNNTTIPKPSSLLRLIPSAGDISAMGSFFGSFNVASSLGPTEYLRSLRENEMSCGKYLDLLILLFRWEAGHVYYQLVKSAPYGVDEQNIAFSLFYGWQMRQKRDLFGLPIPELTFPMTVGDRKKFISNLILIHLFKNEMRMLPKPAIVRTSAAERAVEAVNTYQAELQGTTRASEVYSWAKMIPYLQGLLLYFLAIAYPFACSLMVIPGMHKSLLTWVSFWVWVKLWDVGFALAASLEKTIWAMVGNSQVSAETNARVGDLINIGYTNVDCEHTTKQPLPPDNCGGTMFPIIDNLCSAATSIPVPYVNICNGGSKHVAGTQAAFHTNLSLLDSSMALAGSMNYDLSNSYYVFIMSAIYFAVPAVTGQLVLGAKAGFASLATSAMQTNAQESGRKAADSHSQGLQAAMSANQGSVRQGLMAKAYAQNGAAEAIQRGNEALNYNTKAGAIGAANAGLGGYRTAMQGSIDMGRSQIGLDMAGASVGGLAWKGATGALRGMGRAAPAVAGTGLSDGADVMVNGGAIGAAGQGVGAGQGGTAEGTAGASAGLLDYTRRRDLASDDKAARDKRDARWENAGNNAYRAAAEKYYSEMSATGGTAIAAAQQDNEIARFNASSLGSGAQRGETFARAKAEFAAQDQTWGHMNNWAIESAPWAAAVGIGPGGMVSPGQKPQDMNGMAMMGMINDTGGKAKSEAEYTKKGGLFDGNVSMATDALNENYGSNYVWGGLKMVGFGSSIGAVTSGITRAVGQSSAGQGTGFAKTPVDGAGVRAEMANNHTNGTKGGLAPFGGSLNLNDNLIVPSVGADAMFKGRGGEAPAR